MSTHTPAPWTAVTIPANGAVTVSALGRPICEVWIRDPQSVQAEADARLIAAAPDMLELLRDIYRDPAVRLLGASGESYSARIYGLMGRIHSTAAKG